MKPKPIAFFSPPWTTFTANYQLLCPPQLRLLARGARSTHPSAHFSGHSSPSPSSLSPCTHSLHLPAVTKTVQEDVGVSLGLMGRREFRHFSLFMPAPLISPHFLLFPNPPSPLIHPLALCNGFTRWCYHEGLLLPRRREQRRGGT